MSTNFRTVYFNQAIATAMRDIRGLMHDKQPIAGDLEDLYELLEEYYLYDEELDLEMAMINANTILSEFKQHLIYYLYHNIEDKQYCKELTKNLIQSSDFHYQSISHKVDSSFVYWIDPKEQATALISLARSGDVENLKLLLEKVSALYRLNFEKEIELEEGEIDDHENNLEKFIEYFSHEDKHGYSSLNAACQDGHVEVVRTLLDVAKKSFADNYTDFIEFIIHINNCGVSPFFAACKKGHVEVVRALLDSAKYVFGNNGSGFHDFSKQVISFVNTQDRQGNTALNHVCSVVKNSKNMTQSKLDDYKEIAQLLLNNYANPKITNDKHCSAKDNAPAEWKKLFVMQDKKNTNEQKQSSRKRKRDKKDLPLHDAKRSKKDSNNNVQGKDATDTTLSITHQEKEARESDFRQQERCSTHGSNLLSPNRSQGFFERKGQLQQDTESDHVIVCASANLKI